MIKMLDLRQITSCLLVCRDSPSGLIWRHRPKSHFKTAHVYKTWNARFEGCSAGALSGNKKYWQVGIDYKMYLAHRIVYALCHENSYDDSLDIDHIDCNGLNNNPENLRLATRSDNKANALLTEVNLSGFKGVGYSKPRRGFINRYRARIMVNQKEIHLGTFNTAEKAHAAYIEKAREIYGEFANDGHGNS